MGPDWWLNAAEAAEENHDPAEYEGREWEELTDQEKDEAILAQIY